MSYDKQLAFNVKFRGEVAITHPYEILSGNPRYAVF